VAELGFVRVDQLADECRVSIMTVHRDFLPVVRALAEHPGVELIGLGGRFVASYDSFLGQATAAAGELRTDVLVVSTTAVTDGVWRCTVSSTWPTSTAWWSTPTPHRGSSATSPPGGRGRRRRAGVTRWYGV
jgi:DeoR/GlpR family transcriptional regulator of sugar metabolism